MKLVPPHQLWLGNAGSCSDPRRLHAAGIAAVVELALEEPPAKLSREMLHLRFPLVDGGGNPTWLLRAAINAVAGLIADGQPTLVFCSMGMSRSPAITAAAISRATGQPLSAALRQVATATPTDISPALWAQIQDALTTKVPS
ncbi:MAG: dual specificity protein phosphatase family protein [Phycisphaerales bacterium]